jgi:hypothetical protein
MYNHPDIGPRPFERDLRRWSGRQLAAPTSLRGQVLCVSQEYAPSELTPEQETLRRCKRIQNAGCCA